MATRFEARSLADPTLRDYIARESGRAPVAWPAARWDRRMLTLAAGFYSPALAIARAQLQQERQGIEVAGARPNPTLEFPFEYELNHQGEGKPFTTGPALTWTIETAGKRAARIDQAAAAAAAARLNLLDAAWKVRSQVRAALLGVFAQTSRGALLAEKAGYLEQSVEMLEHRLLAGGVALPDVRRARLALSQAQSELAAAHLALADARARLAATIGVPAAALDGVQFDFSEFEHSVAAPRPADARRTAILHRADLHAALAEYEAGQAALRQEIARQYPDIRLGAGYIYDVGANKISFGLAGLTLPVFDQHHAAIARAEAKRTELAARVQSLQAAIFNELDYSLARYRASVDEARRAAAQAETASRQHDSANARFGAGELDRLELTQARIDAVAFALDYQNAVVTLQSAAGLLEDAMQQALPAAAASLQTNPIASVP